MKKILFLLIFVPSFIKAEELPPFEVKEPAISENFRRIYYLVDKLENEVTFGTVGSTVSVSACGTNPSVIGNNLSGTVTIGTGGAATSCTVTFSRTWVNAPSCTSSHEGAILFTRNTTTTTTLVMDASSALTASGKLKYMCSGFQ